VLRSVCHGAVKPHVPLDAGTQTNPFIHDVNQLDAKLVKAAKLVSEAARADPGVFIMEGCLDGGDRRDRTDDLKLAKLPLSQLSYVPS
jgi:hypothetical protein